MSKVRTLTCPLKKWVRTLWRQCCWSFISQMIACGFGSCVATVAVSAIAGVSVGAITWLKHPLSSRSTRLLSYWYCMVELLCVGRCPCCCIGGARSVEEVAVEACGASSAMKGMVVCLLRGLRSNREIGIIRCPDIAGYIWITWVLGPGAMV